MGKPKLVVFASGTKDGGGSGFENLVEASRRKLSLDSVRRDSRQAARDNSLLESELDADIVAVVSNNEEGGVRMRAERLGIPFIFFSPDSDYGKVVADCGAEWVALSGWFKFTHGLDPQKTFNIHPALFSQLDGMFGGKGMYRSRIHEAVAEALARGEITESGFTMHFVTNELDRGPAFFEYRVPLEKGMTADEIEKAVNVAEHEWQPKITNMVVHGEIRWDGKDPKLLVVPPDLK